MEGNHDYIEEYLIQNNFGFLESAAYIVNKINKVSFKMNYILEDTLFI